MKARNIVAGIVIAVAIIVVVVLGVLCKPTLFTKINAGVLTPSIVESFII